MKASSFVIDPGAKDVAHPATLGVAATHSTLVATATCSFVETSRRFDVKCVERKQCERSLVSSVR